MNQTIKNILKALLVSLIISSASFFAWLKYIFPIGHHDKTPMLLSEGILFSVVIFACSLIVALSYFLATKNYDSHIKRDFFDGAGGIL